MRSLGHIKKLDSGKYLLRLSAQYDDFGNRIQLNRTVDVKTDREAEKALFDFYVERENLKTEKMMKAPETLGELYEEWMKNHVKKSLRKSTIANYEGIWNKYMTQYKKTPLKSMKPKAIYTMLDAAKDSARMRRAIYTLLHSMLGKACIWGYVSENICNRVEPPKYKAKEKEIYTDAELTYIMEAISTEPVVYQTIFYFAVLCGMRRGEIIGLQWDDIDFDNNIFYIKRSATRQTGSGTYTGKPKNQKSERKLNLPETLIPFLKAIRADQSSRKLLLGDKWTDEDYIFTAWNGKIMGVDAPDQWLSRMKKKWDKFPHKDLHTLRHTFATDMILSNIPISTVSGALGHAQQSTTVNIYSHVMEDPKTSAMKSHEESIMKLKKKTVQ